MTRWRRPSRIWRVMPNARIPNGIGKRDARSWASNPSLESDDVIEFAEAA